MLIVLPCVSGTALDAYDCQRPSQVERRQRPSASWCFSSSRQPADTKVESQWTLLQRVSSFEIQGFRCSVYRSRSVYRCGMFSHVSLIRQPEVGLAMSVTAGDCHDMVGGHYFAAGIQVLHTSAMTGSKGKWHFPRAVQHCMWCASGSDIP